MDNNMGGGRREESEDYTDMPGHFEYSGADMEYQGRQDVKYVTVQPGVDSIGEFAFNNCKNLKRIKLLSSVTSIGMAAFQGCESLEKLSIPLFVTCIEGGAFQFCRSLRTLSIPPRVALIGRQAFLGCTSLKTLSIPPSVVTVGVYAFSPAVWMSSSEFSSPVLSSSCVRLGFPSVEEYCRDRWHCIQRRYVVLACVSRITSLVNAAGSLGTAAGRGVVGQMVREESERREGAPARTRGQAKRQRVEQRRLMGCFAYQTITAEELWQMIIEFL